MIYGHAIIPDRSNDRGSGEAPNLPLQGLRHAREVNRAHILLTLDRKIPEATIQMMLGGGAHGPSGGPARPIVNGAWIMRFTMWLVRAHRAIVKPPGSQSGGFSRTPVARREPNVGSFAG